MIAESFVEECQSSLEKGHELWKSYFSKWENLAKHEEVPENDLDLPQPRMKPTKKRKQPRRSKLLRNRKNKPSAKKDTKKKGIPPKHHSKEKIIQQCNSEEETRNKQLEAILKSAFTEILNSNRNKFEIFAVLSKTSQGGSAFLSCHQTSFQFNNSFSLSSTSPFRNTILGSPVGSTIHSSPERNTLLESPVGSTIHSSPFRNPVHSSPFRKTILESPVGSTVQSSPFRNPVHSSPFRNPVHSSPLMKTILGSPVGSTVHNSPDRNTILGSLGSSFGLTRTRLAVQIGSYPSLSQEKFLLSLSGAQTPERRRINLGVSSSAFCRPNSELKQLEWDFRHESPNGVCRKINKEYFIKRSFPEMNITLDGKRFRSSCLRKRTNSVSLSMENSNFITPERKPSERKCFSENVSQRKRRRPSRVFFDNEVEDSESDDQTETRPPIIHSVNKKFKPRPVLLDEVPSDSDDCETIFDRVKTC